MKGFIVFFDGANKEGCWINKIEPQDILIDIDEPKPIKFKSNKPFTISPRDFTYVLTLRGTMIDKKGSPNVVHHTISRKILGGLNEVIFPSHKPIYIETKREYLKREKKEIARIIRRS